MGNAAYNRGTKVLNAGISAELKASEPQRITRMKRQQLGDENELLRGTVASLQAALDATQAELEATRADAQAASTNWHDAQAEITRKHGQYMEVFRLSNRQALTLQKQSAILQCLPTDMLESAKLDAKTYYPHLWQEGN